LYFETTSLSTARINKIVKLTSRFNVPSFSIPLHSTRTYTNIPK
jgi:hypothetical protein